MTIFPRPILSQPQIVEPRPVINRVFAIFTKFCWVGKHVNVSMKPTNFPTQGQPNPRKIRLKVAFGLRFPTANDFSWVGIGFI